MELTTKPSHDLGFQQKIRRTERVLGFLVQLYQKRIIVIQLSLLCLKPRFELLSFQYMSRGEHKQIQIFNVKFQGGKTSGDNQDDVITIVSNK